MSKEWLKGKSYHIIRNEMLLAPAWNAASHLQRSIILALLIELGEHSGKDNGHLIVTNRDLRTHGFSFNAIRRNLIVIEALGFIAFIRGSPGVKGRGRARRFRITFMPIINANGIEIDPPTDEWKQFSTTEQAKRVAKEVWKRSRIAKCDTKKGSLRSDTKKGSLSDEFQRPVERKKDH